jgi:hypothetical protein
MEHDHFAPHTPYHDEASPRASLAHLNAPYAQSSLSNANPYPPSNASAARLNDGYDPYANAPASSGARSTYVRKHLPQRRHE